MTFLLQARAELLEETGYVSDDLRIISSFWVNPAHQTNRVHVLLAPNARRVAEPQPDSTEEIVVDRIPLYEAEHLARTGEFGHAAQVAAILVALGAR